MIPPSSNTGGNELSGAASVVQPKTKIDALTFTARGAMNVPLDLLARHLGKAGTFNVEDRCAGSLGYDSSALLTVDGASVGRIAWGGRSQRDTVHVSLMGTGCSMVGDVAPIVAVCAQEDWRLARVDIAADFVDGSVTYDTFLEATRNGGFHCGRRPPVVDGAGPLDDSDRGRTIYVGRRDSDKFARGYEKGLKELPSLLREAWEEFGIDPGPALRISVEGAWVNPAKWFRSELELKAKKRPLPWDIVDRRDQYYAGAYPYFAEILSHAEPARIVSPRRQGELALEAALSNIQRQYGSTLFTALVAYEGDMGRLLSRIMGDKHNEALVLAGALLSKVPS